MMDRTFYFISLLVIGFVTYDIITTLTQTDGDTHAAHSTSRTKRAVRDYTATTRQSRREEGAVLATLENDLPRRTNRELHLKKSFHAAILSTNEDATKAVRETWAQDMSSKVVMFFRHVGHRNSSMSDSAIPMMLTHLCSHATTNEFSWFVLTTDTVYVDVPNLKALLSVKTTSTPVLLGHASHGKHCSIREGIVFNDHAMAAICGIVTAGSTPSGQATNHTWESILDTLNINCANFLDVTNPSASQFNDEPKPHSPFQQVNSPVDSYTHHLSLTRQTIDDTRRTLARMRIELALSANKVASNKQNNHLTRHFFEKLKQKARITPSFGQFINQTGYASINSGRRVAIHMSSYGTSYKTAKQLAEQTIRLGNTNTRQFAFKTIKTNVGIEYKFYFINSTRKSAKDTDEVTLHQVNIANPFDRLNIHSKHVINQINVTIVTSVDERSSKHLASFLQMIQQACSAFVKGLGQCRLLLVVFSNTIVNQVNALTRTTSDNLSIEFVIMSTRVHGISHILSLVAKRRLKMDTVAYIPMNVQCNNEFLLRCHSTVNADGRTYFPIACQKPSSGAASAGYCKMSTFETFCARANDIAHAYYRDKNTISTADNSIRALYQYFRRMKGAEPLRIPDIGLVSKMDFNIRHHLHDSSCNFALRSTSL